MKKNSTKNISQIKNTSVFMLGLMLQKESSSQVQDKMIYPFSCFVSAFLANTTSTSAKVLLPIQRF